MVKLGSTIKYDDVMFSQTHFSVWFCEMRKLVRLVDGSWYLIISNMALILQLDSALKYVSEKCEKSEIQ